MRLAPISLGPMNISTGAVSIKIVVFNIRRPPASAGYRGKMHADGQMAHYSLILGVKTITTNPTSSEKTVTDLREEYRLNSLRVRSKISKNELFCMEAAEWVMQKVFDVIPLTKETVVAGYWPSGSELDLRPTLSALAEKVTCCLPVIKANKKTLDFCKWEHGQTLLPGSYNLMEPIATDPIIPEIFLMPLVSFDRDGNRLGYGSGYFDKSLARIKEKKSVLCIGIAYSEQEVSSIPSLPHDQKLDIVITEKEIIYCTPKGLELKKD